jgi:hypothetical protein
MSAFPPRTVSKNANPVSTDQFEANSSFAMNLRDGTLAS